VPWGKKTADWLCDERFLPSLCLELDVTHNTNTTTCSDDAARQETSSATPVRP
jgi:hypothetical protein